MAYRNEDIEDADSQDVDLPDEFDVGDDDADSNTEPCPNCGKPVYDGAAICSRCGFYLSNTLGASERKPTWIIVTAIVCIAIVLFVWMGF
jgi:predicted nucleic acid-binding Zn ribbon protein